MEIPRQQGHYYLQGPQILKRLFDIIASLLGLIILSPLILVISIFVKTTSRGSIFYKGTRVGLYGKLFKILKFRSMAENADKIGGGITSYNDKRITKTGKWLRYYKLDEIPQLLNVLKGDMSIVGPRPEIQFYVDKIPIKDRSIILSVKPGISDWASLRGFHEDEKLKDSKDYEKDYLEKILPKKIHFQVKYVKDRTFLKDIRIMFLTIYRIFK